MDGGATMGNTTHIGRVGTLAVALGVGNFRRAATRMTMSIGVAAVVVMATVVPVPTASASSPPCTDTDVTCALILGTSGVPTPDDFYVESVKNQFIAPTHPGQIEYVKVTTPEGLWPSGVPGRLLSLLGFGLGDPEIFGPGGPASDVPWWNLLFELTLDQSVLQGVTDLEQAMAAHPNDHLVIYGYSQSALIANREKRKLAEQYPAGTKAPDIDFVLGGDENLPNGGLFARFPGLYIPILDWSLNGPAPTDTQFDTVEIIRQYDFMGDFPLYPLNLIADLNALLGFAYVHVYPFDVSLAPDASTSPAFQGTHGDTSYYFFENPDLPLFAPLRMLGVPESFIDVFEPFFKVIVDLGYDRSIPLWEPTPARLIPPLNPATVATDLVNAIGEGINNAAAPVGSPPLLSIPAPVTLAAPGTETAKADISPQVMSTKTPTQTEQVMSTGASMDLAASTTTVNETVSADVSRQVTPTEAVSETGPVTSTKKAIETAKANEASTGPRAASAPEASASASTSEPAKPADDGAATAGSSSAASSSAASSSTDSNSSRGDSSDGDAGGS
jgi:hypothetical protein